VIKGVTATRIYTPRLDISVPEEIRDASRVVVMNVVNTTKCRNLVMVEDVVFIAKDQANRRNNSVPCGAFCLL
jgi:hypothetical protein